MGKSEAAWKKRQQEPTKKKQKNLPWQLPKFRTTSKAGTIRKVIDVPERLVNIVCG